MSLPKLTTADIGAAIRDFLEDREVSHLDHTSGVETQYAATIVQVDISAPNNLIVYLDNDQSFEVRISA